MSSIPVTKTRRLPKDAKTKSKRPGEKNFEDRSDYEQSFEDRLYYEEAKGHCQPTCNCSKISACQIGSHLNHGVPVVAMNCVSPMVLNIPYVVANRVCGIAQSRPVLGGSQVIVSANKEINSSSVPYSGLYSRANIYMDRGLASKSCTTSQARLTESISLLEDIANGKVDSTLNQLSAVDSADPALECLRARFVQID